MTAQHTFYQPHAAGLILHIRLTPAGRKNGFDGVMPVSDTHDALKALVTAPPEDGKANKALINLVAKTWRLAKSDVTLISGETSRKKTLLLRGETQKLAAQADALAAG